MTFLKKLFVVHFIALFLISNVFSQENISTQDVLAIGKMTGACGILDSMIQFQKTTRMPGGEEFVLRLWEVEAARLGMSVPQLSAQCDQSIIAYGKLWDVSE